MKSKKNGYTLFEMMIVIGVIIVLMMITMRFSTSRIDDLQAQTSKDDFKNKYEELLLSNISSNYYNGERYSKLIITMQSGAHEFTYALQNESGISGNYIGFSDSKQTITKITSNNQEQPKIEIQLTPYKMGCKIGINDEDYSQALIETKTKDKHHCFKITRDLCKGEYVPCP